MHLIPPTKAALEEHVQRPAYQGGHVWGKTLVQAPELPPLTSWDWTKNEDGMYHPHWTRLPGAVKSCYELISCKCKKGCANRCKAAPKCTALCVCEGSAHRIEFRHSKQKSVENISHLIRTIHMFLSHWC